VRQPQFDSWLIETSAVILITALVSFESGLDTNAAEPAGAGPATQPAIHWTLDRPNPQRYFVEVTGLSDPVLERVRAGQTVDWPEVLSVRSGQGRLLKEVDLPPMAGRHSVEEHSLRFTPQFPLEPGVTYRAIFQPDHLPGEDNTASAVIVSEFRIPVPDCIPTTLVSQIYPSGDVLPENLLKFYLQFSAPMSGGQIYQHIRLLDENGIDVELPFLELDEELWDPEMTRLTLFIDPGRIKREVRPLEEVGPALQEGKRFTLVIESAWPDAKGNPLMTTHEKSFRVGPPDRDPPDPNRWIVAAPAGATRAPLAVDFAEPMDHALAQRLIRVTDTVGAIKSGAASLADHERRWVFEPDATWRVGTHQLWVQTTIEDLAGNNIGKPFEVDLDELEPRRLTTNTVRIAFEVR